MSQTDLANRLQAYDQAFDIYIDRQQLPDDLSPDDPLAGFLQHTIDSNPQLSGQDPLWTDMLRDELMKFMRAMLQLFAPIEQDQQSEQEWIDEFDGLSLDDKRYQWTRVYHHIKQHYTAQEVNIDGYVAQFADHAAEDVLSALIADWRAACDARAAEAKQRLIARHRKQWELHVKNWGNTDYEQRRRVQRVMHHYPQLTEIVRIMGREQPRRDDAMDDTVRRYLPLLPSPPLPAAEAQEVAAGRDLQHLLPSETALLADADTEPLFYLKYAMHGLQLFANRPRQESTEKTEQSPRKPRLERGPIIVAIDTSASMWGRPEKLARCLLGQLLNMARRQRRSCLLISFAVRAKAIDLAHPANWFKLEEFFDNHFSGGTNGEEMLAAGLQQLQGKTYSMADMLIISDFQFPTPLPDTRRRMNQERSKGTRFYGLQIGNDSHYYKPILDRLWQVARIGKLDL